MPYSMITNTIREQFHQLWIDPIAFVLNPYLGYIHMFVKSSEREIDTV